MKVKPFIHRVGQDNKPRPFVQIGQRFYTLERATQIAMDILDAAAASKEAFDARYGKPDASAPIKCSHCGYQWKTASISGARTRCSQCGKSTYIPKRREASE